MFLLTQQLMERLKRIVKLPHRLKPVQSSKVSRSSLHAGFTVNTLHCCALISCFICSQCRLNVAPLVPSQFPHNCFIHEFIRGDTHLCVPVQVVVFYQKKSWKNTKEEDGEETYGGMWISCVLYINNSSMLPSVKSLFLILPFI